MKKVVLACTLLALFDLCLWGAISFPSKNCFQKWQETLGVVLTIISTNYSYSCYLNGLIVETLNQKYEVVITTQKDNSVRLFHYCSSTENYWCCNENQCNLTTIYHAEPYSDCFFFVSSMNNNNNNTYTTLNVSINEEVIAYFNDEGWADDTSPYA